MQRTIAKEVQASGTGLFTGRKVRLRILPAPVDFGIRFRRIDLPGTPEIPARLEYVCFSPRCTSLEKEGANVQMVEHLLSALRGTGIDNAQIEVEGPEIVAADGSARLFVELIESAGIELQERPRKTFVIERPYFWSEADVHLVALPAEEFRISYTLHYPQSRLIGSQFYSFVLESNRFKEEIAPCRTFALYEEIFPFVEKGIIQGAGLENALVIQGEKILNPEGARFQDEMVRHKILDLIGDLSLLGFPLKGHILAVRSGHASNIALAKQIAKMENC